MSRDIFLRLVFPPCKCTTVTELLFTLMILNLLNLRKRLSSNELAGSSETRNKESLVVCHVLYCSEEIGMF